MSDQLRVGLIGLGQMGRNHLRVLSILKGVTVSFAYDVNAEACRTLAASYGVDFRDDLDAALEEVDAVIIATPTVTHEHYIRLAARSVRNIFVEKPLSDTLETSLGLRDFARERDLNLQIGFIERFNPAVQQLRSVLTGAPGVISIDFARTNKLSARITDVDVIADLMIHDIDLALHLSGPVATVSAHGLVQDGMIVFASAMLIHANRRFSRIQASRITDKKMRVIQATCQDMFVNCELLRKEIVITRQSVQAQTEGAPYVISAVEETLAVRPEEALLSELQAFVANSRVRGAAAVPGVEDGVLAMSICDEIQRLVLEGQGSASLPGASAELS
jgi:predicted dehydrogenase